MREIIFIQMGQCGNKIGEKFWETISDEHMINRCGHFYGNNILPFQRLNVYYQSAQNCRFVPRAVMCDLEPAQIYSLRCSKIGRMFNPEHFIAGSYCAGNNWARGYYTEGAELLDGVLEVTRKQSENCDCLQGFQMVHSIGGGTGSGMGSLLLNHLNDEYSNRIIDTFTIIPSEKVSETVVEAYNAVLSLNELVPNTDKTITFDNEALYDICLTTLKVKNPTLGDLNHLISKTMAGITTSFRYPGQHNTDLRKLLTNLVPYPRLKFFLPGFAPLHSRYYDRSYEAITVNSLVKELFDPCYQLSTCDMNSGKYLTCAAIFRGHLSSKEIEKSMYEVQATNKNLFCNWIPNNIKTSICDVAPSGLSSSATFLANTSAINMTFNRLISQFDIMFRKKAFIHWYTGEGMEEQEFSDARDCLVDISDEYEEASHDSNCEDCDDYSNSSDSEGLNNMSNIDGEH